MKPAHYLLLPTALILAGFTSFAEAGNRTLTGFYTGTGDTIPAAVSSCGSPGELEYSIGGVFQVNQAGAYEVVDASNVGFNGLANIRDSSILIYEESFDAGNSTQNLIAAVDYNFNSVTSTETVALKANTDYVLVAQHWCDFTAGPGVWAAVINGPGTFSGAGFGTDNATRGNFASVIDQAVFSVGQAGGETYKYVEARTFTPDSNGEYGFVEIGEALRGSPTAILIYKGLFNANNTSANFFADMGFAGAVALEAGQLYTVVLLDAFGEDGRYQYVTFDTAEPGLQWLTGSWFNPATNGQGVMLEYSAETLGGFLFLAWFTYEVDGGAGLSSAQSVGSQDQRWLTGTASGGPTETFVDVKLINNTGGVFNEGTPEPVPDTNYGTGSIDVLGCNSVELEFDLPEGNSGVLTLQRGLPALADVCEDNKGLGLAIR